MLRMKNLIESLVVKYPLPQRLLEIPEGWDWSITYFFKGKNPVFLKNHYLLNF